MSSGRLRMRARASKLGVSTAHAPRAARACPPLPSMAAAVQDAATMRTREGVDRVVGNAQTVPPTVVDITNICNGTTNGTRAVVARPRFACCRLSPQMRVKYVAFCPTYSQPQQRSWCGKARHAETEPPCMRMRRNSPATIKSNEHSTRERRK